MEPGRLLAGEYPGALTPEKAAAKARLLIDAGVGSIIDLTTPQDHLDSYREHLERAADQAGREVRHFSHPIPDGVIDHAGYDRILARTGGIPRATTTSAGQVVGTSAGRRRRPAPRLP